MPNPSVVANPELVESGDSFTLTVPGGTQVGDRMMVIVSGDGNQFNTPAGWSKFAEDVATTGGGQFATLTIYMKTAVSGDLGGSVMFNRNPVGGGPAIAAFLVVRNSVALFTAVTTGTNLSTIVAPAATVPTPGSLVLRLFVYEDPGASGFSALPTTVLVQDTTTYQSMALTSDGNQATIGTSGTKTATPSASGTATIARTIVFSGGGNPVVGVA